MQRSLIWPMTPAPGPTADDPIDDRRALARRVRHATWIDLVAPSHHELTQVGVQFGLDPLLIEALARPARRPGFTMFGTVGLLVMYGVTPRAAAASTHRRQIALAPVPVRRSRSVDGGFPWLVSRRFRADQVQIVLRDDLMMTVRSGPVVDVERAWDRWASQSVTAPPHCGAPAYILLDTIVDAYIPILDSIVEDVGEIEHRLLDGNIGSGKALDLKDLFRYKRELAQLGRVVDPQRAAATAFWRLAHELFHSDAPSYFQDVADHLARLAQNIDTFHDLLESTLNAHLVLVGNTKNTIMKRLTSVTILAGMSMVVATCYGNNFRAPEFAFALGYPLAMVVTAAALGVCHLYLRRRGFI